MNRNYNIIVNKFILSDEISIDDVSKLLFKNSYSNEIGYGFKDVALDNGILFSKLVFRIPSFILEYNLKLEEFEKKQIFVFSECEFCIDNSYQIIYTTSSNKHFNMLKSIISRILNNKFIISSTDFSPYKLLELFENNTIKYSIIELNIMNFLYSDGAYGRFNAKISKQIVAKELIKTYKNDITKIKFILSNENSVDFGISVSNNSLFSLDCEKNSWETFFQIIKKIIF